MNKRMGGIDFAAIDKQAKLDKKKMAEEAKNMPQKREQSKISQVRYHNQPEHAFCFACLSVYK